MKPMTDVLQHYFPNFVQRRIKAGIKIRLIVDGIPPTEKLLTFRTIKKKFSTCYCTYGNKVLIMSFNIKNPLAIVIEDSAVAQSMRMIFELAWKGAEK